MFFLICKGAGRCWGVTSPTFLKFVGILTKCVGKISRHNAVDKFGVFCTKKTKNRFLSISSPAEVKLLLAMTAFKEVI